MPGTSATTLQPPSSAVQLGSDGLAPARDGLETTAAPLSAEQPPLQPVPRHLALSLSPARSASDHGVALDVMLSTSRRDGSDAGSPAPGSPGVSSPSPYPSAPSVLRALRGSRMHGILCLSNRTA